jgi:hypothetical protein
MCAIMRPIRAQRIRLKIITPTMPATNSKMMVVATIIARRLRAPLFTKSEGIIDTAPGAFDGRFTVGDDWIAGVICPIETSGATSEAAGGAKAARALGAS